MTAAFVFFSVSPQSHRRLIDAQQMQSKLCRQLQLDWLLHTVKIENLPTRTAIQVSFACISSRSLLPHA